MASSKKRSHLKTMVRRRDWLLERKGTPAWNSWMCAELGATQYAIELIEEKIEGMKNVDA